MRTAIAAGLTALALAGCTENRPGAATNANLPALAVSYTWCSSSPPTRVGGIPAGTKTLRFKMVDKQVPGYNHGGGDLPHTGGSSASIPCGAITGGYNGPSPPPPQIHDYEWTVTALDASGSALATGSATRKFPE